ncbi:MAG: TolC family outer membrane protein, partial [Geminicoccaceae bacterium]
MISARHRAVFACPPSLSPITAFLGISIALTSPMSAQAQSLEEALASAYLSNPEIEAQRAAVR